MDLFDELSHVAFSANVSRVCATKHTVIFLYKILLSIIYVHTCTLLEINKVKKYSIHSNAGLKTQH